MKVLRASPVSFCSPARPMQPDSTAACRVASPRPDTGARKRPCRPPPAARTPGLPALGEALEPMPLRTDLVSGAECDRVAWSHHAATEAMGQSTIPAMRTGHKVVQPKKQISARTIPARCCEAKKNRDAPAPSPPGRLRSSAPGDERKVGPALPIRSCRSPMSICLAARRRCGRSRRPRSSRGFLSTDRLTEPRTVCAPHG